MRLYQFTQGVNPRRVTIYLAEKGLDVPRVEVDPAVREHKGADFLALNPAGRVPVLALDDGSTITESAAIVEYLEELNPEPAMIGADPAGRARVRALERLGNDLMVRSQLWLMHGSSYFAQRVAQRPEVAAAAKPMVDELLAALEAHLGDRPFLAGDRVSTADCTAFALFQTCRVRFKEPFGADYPHLDAWYARFAKRPSAAY